MQFICVTLLIITGFTESGSEQYDVVGPSAPLFTVPGEDVILPCSVKPSISAVDMRVEWFRLDLKHSPVVHLYEDHEDKNTDQLMSYRGRTQLFKDELQTGNTSLKLSRLQLSDEGVYKCFIKSKSWTDNIIVDIRVEAIGSSPLITIDGFGASGGLQLQCEIKGWNPEPDLVWLDSEGVTLRPESTDTHRDTDGFRVKHMITVYNSDSKYHCRVQMRHHMLETEIITSSKMFNFWRTSVVLISTGVLLSVITGILSAWFIYKTRELKKDDYRIRKEIQTLSDEKSRLDNESKSFICRQKRTVESMISLFRKFAVNVTLDPDSAHPHLTVSPEEKQVRFENTQQNKGKDEELNNKFDKHLCVIGKEKFSGCFYYEVEVRLLTVWTIGVVRESVNRKGRITLNPDDGYWTVSLREGLYYAWDFPYVPLPLNDKIQRLGVFGDYENRWVAFYDVESMCHIYCYTGLSFQNEQLYPFFCLGDSCYMNSNTPLIICNDFMTPDI